MRLIDPQTAEDYLRDTRRIGADEPVRVRELAGGVSNMVLLVERPQRPGDEFVLKQARGQLRTKHAWFSSVERNWREAEVLTICAELLESAGRQAAANAELVALTPRIMFEDRENYLFGMTAAPRPNTVWKEDLLAGRADPRIAAACGRLLARLHAGSWLDPALAERIGDRTLFDQLRVDPYYRTLAEVRPEARPAVQRLIDSLAEHPRSLVHADFSPKNLLVFSMRMMMVDFETGHYGDPAFDLGFFLSHLVLKACYHAPRHSAYLNLSRQFWQSYRDVMAARVSPQELEELWTRGVQHFAGCAWARLDGKSPVEYLTDVKRRDQMRALCLQVFKAGPSDWPEVISLCEQTFS